METISAAEEIKDSEVEKEAEPDTNEYVMINKEYWNLCIF